MEYKYTNEKGEIEIVELEKWIWGVVYKDGTELHQFDKDGNFHRLAEINQKEVELFTMYESEGTGRYDIVMPEGARIIHKYRNIRPYYMNKFVKVYMFSFIPRRFPFLEPTFIYPLFWNSFWHILFII